MLYFVVNLIFINFGELLADKVDNKVQIHLI